MEEKNGYIPPFSGINTYQKNDKYLIFKLTFHISNAKFKFRNKSLILFSAHCNLLI